MVIDPAQGQLLADRSLLLWIGFPLSRHRLYGYTLPGLRPFQIDLPAQVPDVAAIALNNRRLYIQDALGRTWALPRSALSRSIAHR